MLTLMVVKAKGSIRILLVKFVCPGRRAIS